MIKCPNKNLPEWKELVDAIGENDAYYIWDQNNGYSLDKAPNGAESKLFQSLLDYFKGDRAKAMQAKAKVYSYEFKEWFGNWVSDDKSNVSKVVDENGEPLVVYHGTDKSFTVFEKKKGNRGKNFFFTDNTKMAYTYGKKLYPVFLNLRDAVDIDMNGEGVPSVPYSDIAKNESDIVKIDQYIFENELSQLSGFENQDWSQNKRYKQAKERYYDIAQKLGNITKEHPSSILQRIANAFKMYYYKRRLDSFPKDKVLKGSIWDLENVVEKMYNGMILRNIKDYGPYNNEAINEPHNDYVAMSSNQIKSAIDNNGDFSSETSNIYYSTQLSGITTDVDPTYATQAMFPESSEQSGQTTLQNMLDKQDVYFTNEGDRSIATKLLKIDGVTIQLTNVPSDRMSYDASTRTISVPSSVFNLSDTETIGRAFLHELVHDYTIIEYQKGGKFAKTINKVFDNISDKFSAEAHGREGLYYGLSKPEEFIAEIYTNQAFRELVLKNNAANWQLFVSNILEALHLGKWAKNVREYKTIRVINAIQRVIDNRNTNPNITNAGDGVFYSPLGYVEDQKIQAQKISKKIMNGLNAKYRSMESRKSSPLKLATLKAEIDKLSALSASSEDREMFYEFIQQTTKAFQPVVEFIREAYEDPSRVSNETLMSFKNDFLDFYGPVVVELDTHLLSREYFNPLSPEQREDLRNSVDIIRGAFTEINGKYFTILKGKTKAMIRDYGLKQGIPTQEVEDYIETIMNSGQEIEDINALRVHFQSTKTIDDLGIRTMFRILTDLNAQVNRFADDKAQSLIREFSTIKKSQIPLYFEKDNEGHATGYLVRDLKYGQFKREQQVFLDALKAEYGIEEDEGHYLLNDDDFHEYMQKYDEWLSEHCERKFKPEYYKEFNKLSPRTRMELDNINRQISLLVAETTDETGPHLELLSNQRWKQLDGFYTIKKNLSNIYDRDGELKTGEELQIAQELSEFYESIGDGKIKKIGMPRAELDAFIAEKKATLSPELFTKWMQRNIKYSYSSDFLDLLASMEKKYYGDTYEELQTERRNLMNLGRSNSQPKTDAFKLTANVKDRILEIDRMLDSIRAANKGGGKKSMFSDIAKIVETDEYTIMKEKMRKGSEDAYKRWYKENHYTNSRGESVPASYYTKMVPKDARFLDISLSTANLELDKNSELVNENYDFSNPEYYQPKRSLYDNTEDFQKATESLEQQNIYNLILDTMREANGKIAFLSRRDAYKLPQMTGDMVDFTCRGNKFFKGIKDFYSDSVITRYDDSEFTLDNYTQKPDGSYLYFIPTHYIKALKNPAYISRNLVGMLTEYSRMAENYRVRLDKQADFELFSSQLGSRSFIHQNYGIRSKKDVKGTDSNFYKKYQQFIEMNFYGQFKTPTETKLFKGYKISWTKLMNNLKAYTTLVNLAFNIGALSKALFQGQHKSLVEALAGRYYSMKDYLVAEGNMILNIPKMLYHLGDAKHNNLNLALMEYNGITMDYSEKVKDLQYHRPIRAILHHLFWNMWTATDYVVKTPVVEAIYKDYKYDPTTDSFMPKRRFIREYYNDDWSKGTKAFKHMNTPTLYDVLTVKDGMPVVKDKYKQYKRAAEDQNLLNSVKHISSEITNRIDGMLSNEDKTRLMTNAFGSALFVHRNFYVVNMQDLAAVDYQYNPYMDDYYESKLYSGWHIISKFAKNANDIIKNGTEEKENNKLNSVEKYNFKRVAIQLALVGIYALLFALWLEPKTEKDKNNEPLQYVGYTVDNVIFDEVMEYNPLDFINKVKSPSAEVSRFESLINYGNLLKPSQYSSKRIKKGHYKGMKQYEKTIYQTIPGVRGIIESRDINVKWDWFKNNLDK